MNVEETLQRLCAVCLEETPFPAAHAAVVVDGVTCPIVYCSDCAKLANGTTAEFYHLLYQSTRNVSRLLEEAMAAH